MSLNKMKYINYLLACHQFPHKQYTSEDSAFHEWATGGQVLMSLLMVGKMLGWLSQN